MEEFQAFRVAGTTTVRNIEVENVDGQNIIYWEDIELLFPGVQNVQNGKSLVKFLRDSKRDRIEPRCIKHYPGKVLDVILPNTVGAVHSVSPINTPTDFTSDIPIKEEKATSILIQSKIEAILIQNYGMLEYTIPRLFIVLPDESTSWDQATMPCTKFRLHFICECGEHTKAPGSRIPHHLHLTNHEGYVVNKPTEFFKKYRPFLILMLNMIKLGTSVKGHAVPALVKLRVDDTLDFAQSTIDSVSSKVIKSVDHSLAYLGKSEVVDAGGNARTLPYDIYSYLSGTEGLEEVNPRQFGTYLAANSSDNLLGNLYRMTTKDGYVKWVCLDHYRALYNEPHTQKLCEVLTWAGGRFDEQLGRIELVLRSGSAAVESYDAISRANGVLDLDVSLNWNFARTDSVKLKDMISKSRIKSVTVRLPLAGHFTLKNAFFEFPEPSVKGIMEKITTQVKAQDNFMTSPYVPIFQIMQLPAIQSFEVDHIPKNLTNSSPLSKKADLSNLRHLGIHVVETDADIKNLKLLLSQARNLSTLSLQTPLERLPAVFSSIAEYQIYPIDFKNLSLRFFPPNKESCLSKISFQDLAHLFKVYSRQIEYLDGGKVELYELVKMARA
ncbi:hypothetical protein EDD21DRAFT_420102 [Dissophora ornata]|nr:hypothetical protein EDD21DRAFT_420102 [Dissophora ornata]